MLLSAEIKEVVFSYYQMSLDIDIAGLKAGITDEQIEALKDDTNFMIRLKLEDAQLQEELITSSRSLLLSESDAVKLSAVKELGRIFYNKRFKEEPKKIEDISSRPVNIILTGKGVSV